MSRLFTPFLILYALIEFAAFYGLGRLIGFGWALLLIAGLFLGGLAIAAFETRRIATIVQNDATNPLIQLEHESVQEAAARQVSNATKRLADIAILFIGSFLLVVPGVVSTVIGFIMILPPIRALIRVSASVAVMKRLERISIHGINVMTQQTSPFGFRVPPAPDNAWASEEDLSASGTSWSPEERTADSDNIWDDPSNARGASHNPDDDPRTRPESDDSDK